MIFTERTIKIANDVCKIDNPIVLYRGDYNVEIRFTIIECPYKYSTKNSTNIIETVDASYGQLVIKVPNDGFPIFSDVVETKGGSVVFTLSGEMIDESIEVGDYTFQIRLFDANKESRATIPPIENGISIREPIAFENVTTTNEVGEATVGYALTTAATPEDAFDSQGNYNKTTWGTGDRITAAKLNKIEAGIDGVNKKVASGGTGGQGMTTEQAQQLNTAYTHSQTAHVQASDIPTKTSQLTNDSGYITNIPDEYITETELNAKGYATTSQIPTVPTNVSAFTNDANYTSETYVANKIAEAQLGGGSGEVDLSGYVTKETGNANQITFADGQTFQAKLDAGTLKGEKGDKGADGLTTSISLNDVTYTQENGVITLPNITSGGDIPSVTQVEPEELDMPRVFFYGEALPTSKTDVLLTMDYISNTDKFSSYIKLKCQGTSSMSYAKKNFTVNMYSDEARATKLKKDFKGWGAQSKFCLKANYIDTTHTRNLSGARIAYDMVASRPNSAFKQQLLTAPRYGLVDGFPIKLYFNGEFYGIYTWNIPKDGWMFNMDKSNTNHMVLCAEQNNNGSSTSDNVLRCEFRKEWDGTDGNSWSIEFGTYSDALKNSFNRCINFVMTATDEEFKANIGNYFDLYSLLDYYCFSYLVAHIDGLGKNMLMATYDGVIWGATLYDMDSIYGADWDGTQFKVANIQCPEQYQETNSLLWQRIENCFANELYARYLELRQGALSLSNIVKHVEEIYDIIPDRVFADEKAKWTSLPNVNNNTMTRFRNYMRDRAVYVDAQMLEIGTKVACTGITLSANNLLFTTTDTQTLTATVEPSNTTDVVTWSVSPTGVARVNNGVVTPIANGNCTITATCGSKSATCAVTVSGIEEQPGNEPITLTKTLTQGKGLDTSTGAIITSQNSNYGVCEEYISLIKGNTYTINGCGAWITVLGYNSDKTFNKIISKGDGTNTTYEFVNDCDYIRVGCNLTSGTTITITGIFSESGGDTGGDTNLLDGINTERGYLKLEDGSFVASTVNTDIATDFIPFIGDNNTIYKYEFSGGSYLKVCFYNSSKEFLFGTNTGTIPETTDDAKYSSCSFYSHDSIVKGKGVAYIRCSMNQNSVGSAIAKRSIVNNFSDLLVPEGECPAGYETIVIDENTSTLAIINDYHGNPSGVNGNTIFEIKLPSTNYGIDCIPPRMCIKRVVNGSSGLNAAAYAGCYNRMSTVSWGGNVCIAFTLDSSMVGTTLDEVKAWLVDNPMTVYVPTK